MVNKKRYKTDAKTELFKIKIVKNSFGTGKSLIKFFIKPSSK